MSAGARAVIGGGTLMIVMTTMVGLALGAIFRGGFANKRVSWRCVPQTLWDAPGQSG
ncbi:hypothetical protein [Nonomuraea sp. NPDC049400]|uniref:hypothetical protein n=1 Tax=Nonomuraea sp. NPDC049400 TaxID=3364352 RepID=UPI00379CEB1C